LNTTIKELGGKEKQEKREGEKQNANIVTIAQNRGALSADAIDQRREEGKDPKASTGRIRGVGRGKKRRQKHGRETAPITKRPNRIRVPSTKKIKGEENADALVGSPWNGWEAAGEEKGSKRRPLGQSRRRERGDDAVWVSYNVLTWGTKQAMGGGKGGGKLGGRAIFRRSREKEKQKNKRQRDSRKL